MRNETQVSGAIFATKDSSVKEKETYIIRSKTSSGAYGAGWGLPVDELEPEDLRVLADRIEAARADRKRKLEAMQ